MQKAKHFKRNSPLKYPFKNIYKSKKVPETCKSTQAESTTLAEFLSSHSLQSFLPHSPASPRHTIPAPAASSRDSGALAPPLLLFLLLLLPALAAGHQHPSSYGSSALSEWRPAKASYYAADPEDAIGGACGFGDLGKHGYGMATVGLSTALFERGAACGGCYEVKCVEDLKYCLPGTSIVVTATNFCAPNYGLPADAGGHCNPPNHHFLLPIQSFEKIALWKAGIMPIQYRRVKCLREGGVRFSVNGRHFFFTVLISNVGGAGDVRSVKIKGTELGWLSMGRNWGQVWNINCDMRGQPLSFELSSSDGKTLTTFNVVPKDWEFGKTYTGKQFLL